MLWRRLTILFVIGAGTLAMGLHAQEAPPSTVPPTPTEPATPPPAGPVTAPAATPEEVAGWLRDLGADEFEAREQAMQKLMTAGPAALEAVRAVRDHTDPEVRWRAREILSALRWHCSPELYALVGTALSSYPTLDADGKEALRRDLDTFAVSGPSPVVPVCVELLKVESDPRFLAAWWRVARSKSADSAVAVLAASGAPGEMLGLALKVLRATRSAAESEYVNIANDFAEMLRSLGFGALASEGFIDELSTGGGDAEIYRRCSEALSQAGCLEDAFVEAQKAAFLRPEDAAGWDLLSRAAEAAGRGPLAVNAAGQAVDLAPANAAYAARKTDLDRSGISKTPPPPAAPQRRVWDTQWSRLGNPRDDPSSPPATDGQIVVWTRNYNDRSELVAVDARGGAPLWIAPIVGAAPPPISVGQTSIEGRSTPSSCALGPSFAYVLIRNRKLILRDDNRRRSDSSGWKGESADLCAVDRETGKIAWKTRLDDPGDFQPLLPPAEGLLVLACPVHLHAVDAKTGEVRWKKYVGTEVVSPPLVAGGVACVATGEPEVRGYSLADGSVKWTLALERAPTRRTPLAAAGELVCVADRMGGVTAFDPAAGKVRWSHAPTGWLKEPASVSLAATRERVAVAISPEGLVTCLDAAKGSAAWRVHRFGCQATWLCAAGDAWVASGPQMNVQGISIADGSQMWSVPGPVPVSPAVGGDRLCLFALRNQTAIQNRSGAVEGFENSGRCSMSVYDLDVSGAIAKRGAALRTAGERFAGARDFPAAAECVRLIAEVVDPWDTPALRAAVHWTRRGYTESNDRNGISDLGLLWRLMMQSDPATTDCALALADYEAAGGMRTDDLLIRPKTSTKLASIVTAGLLRVLGEERADPESLDRATAALAGVENDAAVPLLVEMAATGKDAARRFLAAESLAELGRLSDDAPIRGGLGLAPADWRMRAAKRLASFDRPGVREALRAVLADADLGVRRAAARSLAALKDPAGKAVLLAAIEGDHALPAEQSEERWDTAVALHQIDDPKGLTVLQGILAAFKDSGGLDNFSAAAKLLEFDSPDLAPAVQDLLANGGEFVQIFGLGYLEKNGTSGSVSTLIEFAGGSEAEDPRLTAAKTALDLCTTEQLPAVRALLDQQALGEGSHVDWRLLAAKAARLAGDTAASDAAYSAMAGIDPDRVDVWQDWAEDLIRRKEYAQAEARLRPRLEIDTEGGNSTTRLLLMYAVAKQGRTEEAQAHLETALDLAPGAVDAVFNNASWAYCAPPRGTPLESTLALALADRACALDSTSPFSTGTRGTALYRLGRYAEAARQFERSSTDPSYTRLGRGTDSFFLALCRWQLGQREEARATAARAAALDPKSEFAREWAELSATPPGR